MNRRQFLRRSAGVTLVVGTAAGLYTWRIEPHWIEVVERPMPIRNLPPRLAGKRLVQISDLHVGPVVDFRYICTAMERTVSLRPDLVVVTGDLMTCQGQEQVEQTLEVVSLLKPNRTPIFAIPGNHDYGMHWRHVPAANHLCEGMEELGISVLRNSVADFHSLQIAGCDDWWAGRCNVPRTIAQLDDRRAAILLCHNPDVVDLPVWSGYEGWILAGHTHGGQCCFPGYGAPILPISNPRYIAGEVSLDAGRRLYVNRGLGYKQRVRFLSRPEITVFHLQEERATF